jgi:hypothetical protein
VYSKGLGSNLGLETGKPYRVFILFLSPFRQRQRQYLKLGHDCSLSDSIHYSLVTVIGHYITCTTIVLKILADLTNNGRKLCWEDRAKQAMFRIQTG